MPRIGSADFDAIYTTYASYVEHLAGRLVGAVDAPDVAQLTWTSVASALRRNAFRGDAHVRTWLHIVTRNHAFTWLRLHRRQRGFLPLTDAVDQPSPDPTPERLALYGELDAAIWRLSPERRRVILACLQGLTVKEQSAALRIPPSTAKGRKSRGLDDLRAAFA